MNKNIRRGVYHFARNSQHDAVLESWTQLTSGDNKLTEVKHQPKAAGVALDIIIREQPLFFSSEIKWQNTMPGNIHAARADYVLRRDKLTVTRNLPANDDPTLSAIMGGDPILRQNLDFPAQEFTLAPDTIFFPLAPVYLGGVIRQVARFPQGTTVLTPNIWDAQTPTQLLSPDLATHTARHLLDESLILYGKTFNTHVYQFVGGAYDDKARFWLDDTDLLVQAQFQGWEVTLELT